MVNITDVMDTVVMDIPIPDTIMKSNIFIIFSGYFNNIE